MPEQTHPTSAGNPDTLCIFVGGLGGNQLLLGSNEFGGTTPINDVQQRCPNSALHISLDDVGYLIGRKPDVIAHIDAQRHTFPNIQRVVVVGHSLAWSPGVKAALAGVVDALIMVEPVLQGGKQANWPRVSGAKQPGIYAKATKLPPTPFIVQLNVIDGPPVIAFPDCNHNDVPHHPRMIQMIVDACAGTLPPQGV